MVMYACSVIYPAKWFKKKYVQGARGAECVDGT